jgi:hypothetical protein
VMQGRLMGFEQLTAQRITSRHVVVVHVPQSVGQLEQSSNGSHFPLPHTAHGPQSAGHDAHVSVDWQMPSPQRAHGPQSSGQEKQVSPGAVHTPSPHRGHTPQSGAHDAHVSLPSHRPSPHPGQRPQSSGQVKHVSSSLQTWSPQVPGGGRTSGNPVSTGGGTSNETTSMGRMTSVNPPSASAPASLPAKSSVRRELRPQPAMVTQETAKSTVARIRKVRGMFTGEGYHRRAGGATSSSARYCGNARVFRY